MVYLMSITLKKRQRNKCKPIFMISLREKGMIQVTSLEAWNSIENLGDKQRMILNIIRAYPKVSNKEISNILALPINSVTPRVKELRCFGLVIHSGDKMDRNTHKRVMTWEAVV